MPIAGHPGIKGLSGRRALVDYWPHRFDAFRVRLFVNGAPVGGVLHQDYGAASFVENNGCSSGPSCRSSSTGSELVNENLAASSPGTKAETVP